VGVHETYSGALTLFDRIEHAGLHRVRDCRAVPWWERAAPLRPALFLALGTDDRHLVHAGAVGDDRGGVLVVGARGSGKTTVARAAIDHGLAFVADDYLLLDTSEEPPNAVSLYSTASILSQPDGGEKTVIDVGSLRPDSLRESLRVRAVVMPHIRGGRARLRRVSPGVALRAWASSTVFHMPFDGGAVMASLADVVRRVPCFALDVGDVAAELAAAVVDVLDGAS